MSFGACSAIFDDELDLLGQTSPSAPACRTSSAALQNATDGRGSFDAASSDALHPASAARPRGPATVARARGRRMTRLCPDRGLNAESSSQVGKGCRDEGFGSDAHRSAGGRRSGRWSSTSVGWADWSPETYSATWIDGATGPEVGARFKGKNKRRLFKWTSTVRVTECEPGRTFEFVRGAGQARRHPLALRVHADRRRVLRGDRVLRGPLGAVVRQDRHSGEASRPAARRGDRD